MMSADYFDKLRAHLDLYRDDCRREEFRSFLLALYELRSIQMITGMVKEGLTDFAGYTPAIIALSGLSPVDWREEMRKERLNINYWNDRHYRHYQKVYSDFQKIERTFPKEEQFLLHHDEAPTELYEFLYCHFFPLEPEQIIEKFKNRTKYR